MAFTKRKKLYLVFPLAILVFIALATYLNDYEDRELESMQVVLTAKVPEDDTFQLFFWEESESKFDIKNSVRTKIQGADSLQEIIFRLPTLKNLFRLRLDIGENINQGAVIIKQITFVKEYQDHIYNIQNFNRLFKANQYIEQEGQEKFKGIPGKRENNQRFYDPYFISVDNSPQMEQIRINRLTSYPYLIAGFVCLVLMLFAFYNIDKVSLSQKDVFIFVFVIMLLLPSLQSEFQFIEPLENTENRKLAPRPDFELSKKFANGYTDYYSDHFGFRNYLTKLGGSFKVKIFKSSTHPDKVQLGKEKWLYYNNFQSNIFKSYSNKNLLPPDSLELIVKAWEQNQKRYQAQGRKYTIAFWPDKHTIYPEFLPATMRSQIKDTLSRADQVIQYIEENKMEVNLTDVRQSMLQAKEQHQVFHKFDTHWNDFGAFTAYQCFFEKNFENLEITPFTEDEFNIAWRSYSGGDLIQMLGIHNNGYFIEKQPDFTPKINGSQIEFLPTKGYPRLTVITRNNEVDNNLKALVFRDSFTNGLIQFISLHFREVYYIWGPHKELLERINPDVIIEAYVERDLGEKML